jgi:hypothetical protein
MEIYSETIPSPPSTIQREISIVPVGPVDPVDVPDAMIEEYQSILKNDVRDIFPRPEGNSVLTSKWIYKIKNAANVSVEK